MKKNISLLCFLLGIAQWVSAQAQDIQRFKLTEISFQPGLFLEAASPGTLNDFKKLAPQSQLLQSDFNSFNETIGSNIHGSPMVSALAGISMRKKSGEAYRSHPLIRLGFSYVNGATLRNGYVQTETVGFDTLISTQSGETLYKDSTLTQTYYMQYTSTQFRLDASVIFRTNPEARMMVFGGVGLNAGLALNSGTNIHYVSTGYTELRDESGNNIYGYNRLFVDDVKSERFQNKRNFGLALFMPMGFDFRLGNKENIWNKLHVFYEIRPGVNMSNASGIKTMFNGSVQQGIGIKINV